MAITTKGTNDALTVKLWNEKLFRDFRVATYFDKFTGKGPEALIHEKDDFTKKKGDEMTFGLVYALTGAGVTGNQTLSGSEEALSDASFKLTLQRYRHGVRDDGDLHRRRAVYEVSSEIREKLKLWAAEKHDKLIFDAYGIGANVDPATNADLYFYNNNGTFTAQTVRATAVAAMNANTGIQSSFTGSFGFISALRTWAETGGAGGPNSRTRLQPIRVDGEPYYVLLVHPDALYDLKTSAPFQQAQREAQARGKDNPIFKNATAIIDGVVIHAHKDVFVANNGGGGSQRYCVGAFLGAQSMCIGFGEKVNMVEEEEDYKEFQKFAVRWTAGYKKPKFNGKDYGSVGVTMSCSAISNK
jgi:N4-gp56 family major capsid protein